MKQSKIIKVKTIEVACQDTIFLENEKDLHLINKEIFGNTFIFELEGVLHLIGECAVYCCQKEKSDNG